MYNEFAYSYDALMTDVDYKKRTDYICSLFKTFDHTPTLMLDLACGTGEFSNRFAKKGVSVIGVDIAQELGTLHAVEMENVHRFVTHT